MPDQAKTEKSAEVFCFSIWHRDFTEFKKPAYNMRGFQKGSFLRIGGGRQPSAHTSALVFLSTVKGNSPTQKLDSKLWQLKSSRRKNTICRIREPMLANMLKS